MLKVETFVCGPLNNNVYIITDKETGQSAVIDPGFLPESLEQRLQELGDSVRYIFLTHRHFDHILAVPRVKELTGAKVYIHAKDACGLSSSAFSMADTAGVEQAPFSPDYIFKGPDTVMLGKSAITVIETPGHTIGGVCYWCGDHLFTGDTLFRMGAGRSDFPTGNFNTLLESLRKLAALPLDCKVYPGHEKCSTLDVERTLNPFMIEAQK